MRKELRLPRIILQLRIETNCTQTTPHIRMGQSNSTARSRSRSKSKKKKQEAPLPSHANFIIFLAANLTTFTSRLIDMAAPSASDQDESTPLLQRDDEPSEEPHSKLRDIGIWFTHHAVSVVSQTLPTDLRSLLTFPRSPSPRAC